MLREEQIYTSAAVNLNPLKKVIHGSQRIRHPHLVGRLQGQASDLNNFISRTLHVQASVVVLRIDPHKSRKWDHSDTSDAHGRYALRQLLGGFTLGSPSSLYGCTLVRRAQL